MGIDIALKTFSDRVNKYKYPQLKSYYTKLIENNYNKLPEDYSKLLDLTLKLKTDLPEKFVGGMVKSKDLDNIIKKFDNLNEAERDLPTYDLFDVVTDAIEQIIGIFNIRKKDKKDNFDDIDDSDKNLFDNIHKKYSNLKPSKDNLNNFKIELLKAIEITLNKLRDKNNKVIEESRNNFNKENIKKYLQKKYKK
jgi:hypothetical protein